MRIIWAAGVVILCAIGGALAKQVGTTDQASAFDPKTEHPPVILYAGEAQMPDGARRSGHGGICVLSLTVDVNGFPKDLHIIRCTDPMFIENSLAAAMKYKFKPATTLEGKVIPVTITAEITFSLGDLSLNDTPPAKVHLAFLSPPGASSTEAGTNGIYPLTRLFDPPNEFPKIVKYTSEEFGRAALTFPDGVGCDVELTIDGRGKPSNAQVLQCDKAKLEQPAADSLLKSKYKPARLNGKAVPVRVTVHLTYEGFGSFSK